MISFFTKHPNNFIFINSGTPKFTGNALNVFEIADPLQQQSQRNNSGVQFKVAQSDKRLLTTVGIYWDCGKNNGSRWRGQQ